MNLYNNENNKVEGAIRLIAAGVSHVTGDEFYRQLVLMLAEVFNADCALIGLLDETHESVTTIALSEHGQIASNVTYPLTGTPCANVANKGSCVYGQGVQWEFPEDMLLVTMAAEAYIGTPLFDANGEPMGLIAVIDNKPIVETELIQDILEIFAARAGAELQRQRAESHIREMAYRDHLTGLANRTQLNEWLAQKLTSVQQTGSGCALLLIDLDNFKTINDTLGHDTGDELLKAVAGRITRAAGDEIWLARLGGDEFVALVDVGCGDASRTPEIADALAQRIRRDTEKTIVLGERAFCLGVSVGIAQFTGTEQKGNDVLRHADMALYRAKARGRGTIQFYLPSMQEQMDQRVRIEAGLREAIRKDELQLYFQPQVDLDGRMRGAEALLRWQHPQLGQVSPAMFIPIAEESGLIHSLGTWVMETACSRLIHWLGQGFDVTAYLSLNVSPWQFARSDFIDDLTRRIADCAIEPRHIMLELTETALLYDIDEAIEKLSVLRESGVRVALDDFGTGYSSLAYLRDLPLDQIKIDKGFIKEIGDGRHPLVASMIDIGRNMNLDVVAEGVETGAQLERLIEMGCRLFQGYYYCPPLPEQEFVKWLDDLTSN